MTNDRLLSTGEAARALRLNSRSISRWAKQGLIKPTFVTPGGQYRWDLDELREQLRTLRTRDE
jgi:excisionase family DNA binding protein